MPEEAEGLRSAYRKIVLWKYFCIFLALAFMGWLAVTVSATPNTPQAYLSEAVLVSLLATLFISLLYDIFLKSEAELSRRMELEDLARQLTRGIFRDRAARVMSADDIESFVGGVADPSIVVGALAGKVVADPQLQEHLKRNYFRPLLTSPRFRSLTAKHTLGNVNPVNQEYAWTCRHSFVSLLDDVTFRLLICESDELAAQVTNAGGAVDFIVLLSKITEPGRLRDWVNSHLTMSIEVFEAGKRQTIVPSVSYDPAPIEMLLRRKVEETEGIYCQFRIESGAKGCVCTLEFEQQLSLSDPYFCWTSEEYVFVDSIEVDYSGLQPHIGRMSVVNYIGSPSAVLEHNRSRGIVRARVNDMLSPGSGFVLVMRPKEQKALP